MYGGGLLRNLDARTLVPAPVARAAAHVRPLSPMPTRPSRRPFSLNRTLDGVQEGLDWVGFTPAGVVTDPFNALISAGRGRWKEAGINAAATIPIAGDALKAAKKAKQAAEALKKAQKARKARDAARASVRINPQKQAGHVPGTPQHANRTPSAPVTSTFFGQRSGDWLTRDTATSGYVPNPQAATHS